MGREKFASVLDQIEKLGPTKYCKLYIYGTIGYGKSHILAAMTCLLLQQGKRVVYLPDCRVMTSDFVQYIKSSLLLAFGDSEPHQLEIQMCDSVAEIKSFCRDIAYTNIQLYFIIDQLNALDLEDTNKDEVNNETKQYIRKSLNEITFNHYIIESASANHKSAMHMEQKQDSKAKISLMGGMIEVGYFCHLMQLFHTC